MEGVAELRKTIKTPLGEYAYYSLKDLTKRGRDMEELPFSIRILVENVIRNLNGTTFTQSHLENILNWSPTPAHNEIPYLPSRVLMQDFTGVPSIVDIASLRSEVARKNTGKHCRCCVHH